MKVKQIAVVLVTLLLCTGLTMTGCSISGTSSAEFIPSVIYTSDTTIETYYTCRSGNAQVVDVSVAYDDNEDGTGVITSDVVVNKKIGTCLHKITWSTEPENRDYDRKLKSVTFTWDNDDKMKVTGDQLGTVIIRKVKSEDLDETLFTADEGNPFHASMQTQYAATVTVNDDRGYKMAKENFEKLKVNDKDLSEFVEDGEEMDAFDEISVDAGNDKINQYISIDVTFDLAGQSELNVNVYGYESMYSHEIDKEYICTIRQEPEL